MTRIVKEFTWAMAHRLTCGYKGKCRNLHGHTYKCAVELEARELNKFGMVVDFGWVKDVLKGWVDKHLDHAVLAADKDEELQFSLKELGSKMSVMPSRYSNTTAEQMADMLFVTFRSLTEVDDLGAGRVRLVSVTVWETDTAKATRSIDHVVETQ
jgi:6-pyruvoyltetrahydropterin/6-carboxytetrahydropterin synthase